MNSTTPAKPLRVAIAALAATLGFFAPLCQTGAATPTSQERP